MKFVKLIAFLFWTALGGIACAASWVFLRWSNPKLHFRFLARTAQWTALRISKVLRLTIQICVERDAAFPSGTVLVAANHRSYLDVVVLQHLLPLRFVSKSEVRAWPFIGMLTILMGSVFCRRGSPRFGHAAMNHTAMALGNGTALAFFPEGTSSIGLALLTFSNLFFESAVLADCPVVPVHLEYIRANGKRMNKALRDQVCWAGAQTFLPHFWSLLGLDSIEVEIRVGTPLSPTLGRKTLCRASYAEIVALSQAWKFDVIATTVTSRKYSRNNPRTVP